MVRRGVVALSVLALLGASGAAHASDLVVGRARGGGVVSTATVSAPLVAGRAIAGDALVEVVGWCELWTAYDGRLRLGASARLRVRGERLWLERGRAWVQVAGSPGARSVELAVGRWVVEVAPGASVVLEQSATGGETVAVRSGQAEIHSVPDGLPTLVRPGEVARGDPVALRAGGRALLDLVAMEAREAQGDPSGLRAFLIERSRVLALGPLDTRAVSDVVRVDAELAGVDGGPLGLLLEEALRPPAFFEREVPSKGPNVEIAVEFAE